MRIQFSVRTINAFLGVGVATTTMIAVMDQMKKVAHRETAASRNSGAVTVVVFVARCVATESLTATTEVMKLTATRHAAKANSSAPIQNSASRRTGVVTVM